jgi:putative membrane protein
MWNAMGSYGWGASLGWGWFGITHMLLWWLLLLLGIAVLAKWLFAPGGGEGGDPGKRPLDILAERYARGGLDRVEYEKRKRELSS